MSDKYKTSKVELAYQAYYRAEGRIEAAVERLGPAYENVCKAERLFRKAEKDGFVAFTVYEAMLTAQDEFSLASKLSREAEVDRCAASYTLNQARIDKDIEDFGDEFARANIVAFHTFVRDKNERVTKHADIFNR